MNVIKQPVKNALFLTGFFILISLVTACDAPNETSVSLKGNTMGTTYHIVVSSEVAKNKRELLHRDIDALLLNLNQSFSTYIESSEVSQLNQYTGNEGQIVSADFIEVLSEALHISELTQGAYDITVGPLVNLSVFGPTFKAD